MISPQDEKCRTSVKNAEYLKLYPWVQKMKVWRESGNILMKTGITIWYICGPCQKCSDKNQVCDMQSATKFIPWMHPYDWKQYCDNECQNLRAPTITLHVFFVFQLSKLTLEGGKFDDNTMIPEQVQDAHMFHMQDTRKPYMSWLLHIHHKKRGQSHYLT